MLKLKKWLLSLLAMAVIAVPAMAGNNDAKTANGNTANTTSAEASPAPASPSPSPSPSPSLTSTTADADVTALLGVLVKKGVLDSTEVNAIRNASPTAQFQALVETLSRKGLLSAADLSVAAKPAAQPAIVLAAAPVAVPETVSTSLASAEPESSSQAAGAKPPMPPPPAVVPAIVPIRVFPVDPPKTGGLSGIKAGPITLAPYGFIKASVVHDSSDPDGDDFPFPGIWLNAGPNSTLNTGPTKDPEVHVKARSTRFGLNLEWPDISKNLTLTGKIEGDFEGNFSEVDNRDVSSIRSNMPQLRLAFVRMDYHASDATDIFFVGGQDWTLFGSGALTDMFETTFNAAFWGDVYTRSPQLRVGFVQTLSREHKVKLEGQFGIMMPSTGEILKLGNAAGNGLAAQLGQGEREGADADRPEWEGRAALSFQLDKAPGVAPAQIALSGFRSRRTSIVPNSSYCLVSATETCSPLPANTTIIPANYQAAFPNGFEASSVMWGGQITAQLPTRWFTLVASAYKGADMRFYFGGQINSFYTNVSGLTNVVGPFETADGGPLAAAGGALLGTNAAGQVVVAPQKPIQGFGGFVQLGLPLSRWFNANPHGHNAGWQVLFTVGKDQVVDRDQNAANGNTCASADYVKGVSGVTCGGGLPLSMGKMGVATLYYKFNNWCRFGFEQSVYATRIYDHADAYVIAGVKSNEWQDHRSEFGPIFTF